VNSGFAPLTLPGALAPRIRTRRRPDLRLAWCVLATVLLAEAALGFFPQAMLLHPVQGTVLFKQLSGYAMVALMAGAMAFGWLRRRPSLAARHRLLGDVHQFGGLLLLLLLSLHVATRPGGFLLGLFHAIAIAQGAGALRALLGSRLGRSVSTTLLAVHITLSCLASAAVVLHLYFVYAYTA
jgi:hypothetical protein